MLYSTQVWRELDENRARPGGAGNRQASEHFVAYQKVRDENISLSVKQIEEKQKLPPSIFYDLCLLTFWGMLCLIQLEGGGGTVH